jgi:hypothetical protein
VGNVFIILIRELSKECEADRLPHKSGHIQAYQKQKKIIKSQGEQTSPHKIVSHKKQQPIKRAAGPNKTRCMNIVDFPHLSLAKPLHLHHPRRKCTNDGAKPNLQIAAYIQVDSRVTVDTVESGFERGKCIPQIRPRRELESKIKTGKQKGEFPRAHPGKPYRIQVVKDWGMVVCP